MSVVLPIVLKGLAGGVMVVVFSAIGEMVQPRALAGISSGAPSIAIAGLLIALLFSGVAAAVDLTLGLIAGAAALILWCLVGIDAVKRFGALRGSVVTTGVWFVAALSLWAVFLR